MSLQPQDIGSAGAWVACGLGAAMILYAWIAENRNEWRRNRLSDCGMVLLFGATLVLTLIDGGPKDALEWFVAIFSPIVIAAALWRLSHTSAPR